MSSLYISEFANLPISSNGVMTNAGDAAEWVADQKVTIAATSAASNPFNAATQYVLLSADAVCSITCAQPGSSATATASKQRLPANAPKLFGVRPGMSVGVIENT
jgi:hypothetical protein